jgi:hypothetical protein
MSHVTRDLIKNIFYIKTISDIYAEFDALDTKATGVLTYTDIQERVEMRTESEKQRELGEVFSGKKASPSGSPVRSHSIRSTVETSMVINELHFSKKDTNRITDDMDDSPI